MPFLSPSIFAPGQFARKYFASAHDFICEQYFRPSQLKLLEAGGGVEAAFVVAAAAAAAFFFFSAALSSSRVGELRTPSDGQGFC
jgi:hypothetical protein